VLVQAATSFPKNYTPLQWLDGTVTVRTLLYVNEPNCRDALATQMKIAQENHLKAQPGVVPSSVTVVVACTDLQVAHRGCKLQGPKHSLDFVHQEGNSILFPRQARRRRNLLWRLSGRRELLQTDPGVVYGSQSNYAGE
jgi:hypothetical protein